MACGQENRLGRPSLVASDCRVCCTSHPCLDVKLLFLEAKQVEVPFVSML